MKSFFNQLKWQFVLLQKNNIISISLALTFFYGVFLYLLKDIGHMNKVLVGIVLNDPATIGYFFLGLSISTEEKHGILSALFVTPINPHLYLITKVLALSIIGCLCALIIGIAILGFSFNLLLFSIGTFSISIIAGLLGVIVITHTFEFLKFALFSIPIFITFVNFPFLDHLGVIDLGQIKNVFPVQGGISLLINSTNETTNTFDVIFSLISIAFWIPIMYFIAFRFFKTKVINI